MPTWLRATNATSASNAASRLVLALFTAVWLANSSALTACAAASAAAKAAQLSGVYISGSRLKPSIEAMALLSAVLLARTVTAQVFEKSPS
ncbi:MAG: hypothetical protein BWY37_01167 [Firmicutes bacterium ADurb.Bin262]|nr:MAG: hypothetical protein BWY37_01167 [Firmicutes bacterium ADurb.Bin262]